MPGGPDGGHRPGPECQCDVIPASAATRGSLQRSDDAADRTSSGAPAAQPLVSRLRGDRGRRTDRRRRTDRAVGAHVRRPHRRVPPHRRTGIRDHHARRGLLHRVLSSPGPSNLLGADVVVRAANEQLVELSPYSSSVTYDVPGHDGRAVWSFRAAATGDYTVTTDGQFGIVAVGPGLGRGLFGGILVGVGLILVTAAAAIVGIIVVAVHRGRSRRPSQPLPIGNSARTVPRQPPPPPSSR